MLKIPFKKYKNGNAKLSKQGLTCLLPRAKGIQEAAKLVASRNTWKYGGMA